MKYFVLATFMVMLSHSALALVDMKNANYSETWTDLELTGAGYDLRVQRTYNSRTLFNGIFGFGWCSDFETTLEITSEGNIKVTECGGGLEVYYTPKDFNQKEVDNTIDKIVKVVKEKNPSLTPKYLNGLKKELKVRSFFREEMAKQLKLAGSVKANKTYFASGRINEQVVLNNGVYTRSLGDGTNQKFDKDGKLTALYDKNSNYLKISYNKDLIAKVIDNNGRSLDFEYWPQIKKVRFVKGPGGKKTEYKYDKENLVESINTAKEKFKYKYDDLHNMERVDFPDKTAKVITYDKEKDWVTSFTDRRQCKETYDYDENKKDPLNHYWSTVTKVCNGKVTNKSRFEFWHRFTKNGKRYLHRSLSNINGDETDLEYHPVFGKPISIKRNKIQVRYAYYGNGLVKNKFEPLRNTSFEYKNACRKVSSISTDYFAYKLSPKTKKRHRNFVRKVKTNFAYREPKCNLISAKNSDGQSVQLLYDSNGRIAKITDQSKKIVSIQYESRFGKPWIVERPGLGTITVTYKNDGSIKNIDSKDGPRVAAQVASIFNNLLEIISPATSELNI